MGVLKGAAGPAAVSPLWQRAAVVGSLWAASEIVLGSFLHNLRVPFSGHVLTAIAILVLVAGHRRWPQDGLIARAGLIAAVMKSASPSAVLFGPMLAIAAEAMAMEAGVRLLGGRLPGYALGGALAMSWTLVHKVLSLLLTYGADVVPLYREVVAWAEKQVGPIPLGPWGPLAALALLNLAAGAAVALCGSRVGRSSAEKPVRARPGAAVADWRNRVGPSAAKGAPPSLVSLAGWCLVLPGGMFAFTRVPLAFKAALAALVVLAALVRYRRALRHLGRPGFWLALVGLTLASGGVAGALSTRPGTTFLTGLEAGAGMSLHAVFVSISFAAISVEFAHPRVRSWAQGIGGGQPHRALQAAFSALPLAIAALPPGREIVQRPFEALGGLLPRLEGWLAEHGSAGTVAGVVTGHRGEGKTTFVEKVVGGLRGRGLRVAGILSPGELREGVRWTIDLEDLSTGLRRPFATRERASAWPEAGAFFVDPEGLAAGERALSPEVVDGADLVVVDEVGPWELAGNGWAEALERLRGSGHPPLLLVVRRSLADEVLARFAPSGAPVWDVSRVGADEVVEVLSRPRAAPFPG